jgi:hypothetical protein
MQRGRLKGWPEKQRAAMPLAQPVNSPERNVWNFTSKHGDSAINQI